MNGKMREHTFDYYISIPINAYHMAPNEITRVI